MAVYGSDGVGADVSVSGGKESSGCDADVASGVDGWDGGSVASVVYCEVASECGWHVYVFEYYDAVVRCDGSGADEDVTVAE